MDLLAIVAIGLGALLVGFLLALWVVSARSKKRTRTQRLQSYFGDEYDSTVDDMGERKGEKELERRIDDDEVQPTRITPGRRTEHTDRWREIQYSFLDDPAASVRDAERLVVDVMSERGFTVDDIGTRSAALSVEQPDLADRYRDAHATHRRAEEGNRDIESLFEAMGTYRAVFDAVLLRPQSESGTAETSAPGDAPGP